MSSGIFRYVRSDGSWPLLTVGGDIGSYERCLKQFADAWTYADEFEEPEVESGEQLSIEAQVMAAYLRGCQPRRPVRLAARLTPAARRARTRPDSDPLDVACPPGYADAQQPSHCQTSQDRARDETWDRQGLHW